jgi:prepilin-type N-terminal cleavage/methylation domain-containing protein
MNYSFNQHKINKTNSGFTMIELLIVIVIMGILAAVGIGTFTSSQLKARDSQRKTDLRTLGDAFEAYYNDYGSYPIDNGAGGFLGCGVDGIEACGYGLTWVNDRGTTYMVQIPTDPNDGAYYYISDGTYFRIFAHLENERDRDVPLDASEDPTYYTEPFDDGGSGACATGDCNYGRSSSNVDLGAIQL